MARADHKVKIRLEAEDNASPKIKKAEKSARSLGQYLSDKFVITLGDVTRAASKAWGKLQEAVTLKAQEKALAAQLVSMGEDFDTFIAKLKEVSANTVSTGDLIASSSRALFLGIPADKISGLLEGARVAAVATGAEVSNAFEDITKGIARASPLILDNLGLVYEFREKNNPYDRVVAGGRHLLGDEGNWHAIALVWVVNNNLTIAGGWARLGEVLNSDLDGAWAIQVKYEF